MSHSQDFAEVLGHIQPTRQRVFAQAHIALIDRYWRMGQTLSHKVAQGGWGKGVLAELARYIAHADPTIKGFSDKNLWRMKQFFETYQGNEEFSPVARVLHPDIDQAFKDRYVLEFLGLPEPHSESDLQRALVQHMKAFVLELGKDFLFVGEEFRLQVGNQDFFIDLLFFHRGLSALVAFELKVGQFKPEHKGQLNFYLEALDRDVKKPPENPSIGVLLCCDKDDEVVEYALSRNLSPALVAQYQLQLPDKKLIAARLHELLAMREGAGDE